MFSSIASFLFGSNTSATANCEPNQNPIALEREQQVSQPNDNQLKGDTNSATGGSGRPLQQGKRAKNKYNNKKNKNKKEIPTETKRPVTVRPKTAPQPDDEFDVDENDWFIVDKEGDSFPRSDSEELYLVKENRRSSTPPSQFVDNQVPQESRNQVATLQQQTSHSSYNGPRPQQHCNRQKRARKTSARHSNVGSGGSSGDSGTALHLSTLSPSRSLPNAIGANAVDSATAIADAAVTQSLYVVPVSQESGHNVSGVGCDSNGSGAKLFTMVDSWYVTPPPCFISAGPIHMETSPFENLLIEHPSMSVYHSIRSAQEAVESFESLDLGVNEPQQMEHLLKVGTGRQPKQLENTQLDAQLECKATPTDAPIAAIGRNSQIAAGERTTGPHIDRYNAVQMKLELFARNSQKCLEKLERQNLRRSAILRGNKVRDIQGRGNRQRRADLQHCRLISGANNNRKCCY